MNRRCKFELHETVWKYKSQTARDLIEKLLQKNPDKRITAVQALNHPWFNQDGKQDGMGVAGV